MEALVSGVLVAEAVPEFVKEPQGLGEVEAAGMPDPDACFPNRPCVFATGDAVLFLNRPAKFAGGLVVKIEGVGVGTVDFSLPKLNNDTCCAADPVVLGTVAAFEGGRAGATAALDGGRAGATTREEGVAPLEVD